MNRRDFLGTMAAATTALSEAGAETPPRLNVIMLYSDDQRFDTIAALGNPDIRTPNMDRLAAQGCAFTHTFTMGGIHGALCIPSRAMLMTGRTLYHSPDLISPATPMWPEVFAEAGYSVGGIGKWHNDRASFARAFKQGGPVFFGGMSDHDRVPLYEVNPAGAYPEGGERIGEGHSSAIFADAAIRFIQNHRGPEPFFLYTAFTAPHDPRMSPPPYDTMYDPEKIALPPSFMPVHPFDNGELVNRDEELAPFPRTPGVVRRHIADYYGVISYLDAQIGRILDALAASPHAGRTLVVFAGDNGLALGRHGLMGKQSVYDHSLRVPLIFMGPGVPRGVRRDGLCYLLDIFPTVCELTGVRAPSTVEGQSLRGAIRGPGHTIRPDLFLPYRDLMRAVRDERWKLIEYRLKGARRTQLFDLRADPWELHDQSANPSHSGELARLRRRLADWQAAVDDPSRGAGWG